MNGKKVPMALLVVWFGSALMTIIALPDFRYQDRLARTEKLLRTHCSSWSWHNDSEYVSTQHLLVTKCFPKQT